MSMTGMRATRSLRLRIGLGFCCALLNAQIAAAQMPLPAPKPPDGATLFKQQCATCHTTEADFAWDEITLDTWITNPQEMIPGSIMAYRQARPEIRAAIIAYLKELH
jgi:cytochrome c